MVLTKIPGSLITDATITSADILDSTITNAKLAVDPANASNLNSGDVPLAQLGNVPDVPDPDLSAQINDIATLALHSAVANNLAAYNLANSFVDQYEDSTGLDVLTDVVRDTSGEYMTSVSGYGGNDAYTVLLLHCDAGGTSSTFVDSSVGGGGHTMTSSDAPSNPNQQGSGATIKFGASSGKFNNVSYISTPDNADWFFDDGDWTIDFWLRHPQHCSTDHFDFIISQPNSTSPSGQSYFGTRRANSGDYYMMGNSVSSAGASSDNFAIELNEWAHYAICQNGDLMYHYKDGTSVNGVGTGKTSTIAFQDLNVPLRIGYQQDVEYYNGWADEIRISKGIARYPSGTSFTPATQEYDELTVNATGNYTSSTETANATVSKMSIVVLYKNAYGTATLDTDLVAQVSSDGGSNYVSAPLTAAGTFSTGVLIAKSNDITISNTGTAPKYKISFANQASSSKETQVHGVSMIY